MAALGWLWFSAVSATVVIVSITDWRRRLVANLAVATLTGLAIVFLAAGQPEALVVSRWSALAVAVVVFAVGVGMYGAGLVAAGDVKLLLPVALIMTRLDPTAWLFYLGTLIAAAAVVLAVFARRDQSLPLAPVIGLGLIPALLAAPPPFL